MDDPEHFRKLVEDTKAGYFRIDQEGRFQQVNLAWLQMHGYSSPDEIIGKHFSLTQVETDLKKAQKNVERLLSGKPIPSGEFSRRYKDGSIGYHIFSAHPIMNSAGEVVGLEGFLIDTTRQKKTEERLKLLNECFLKFGADPDENINRLVSLCGKFMGGTCAFYNRLEDEKLCSWGQWNVPPDYKSVDAPEGHICYDVIKGSSDEVVVIRDLPKTEYAQTDPNVLRYNLNTYVGVAVTFANAHVGSLCVVFQKDFVPDEDDKRILGIIASAIGVEEKRKKAEQAVTAAAKEWTSSFDAMTDGVSIHSTDYTIINVNQSLCRLLGKTADELIGKKCYQVFHEKDSPIAACPLAGPTGPYQKEFREIFEPGVKKWLATSTSPVLDEAGNLMKIVHTVRDVTERKQAEEELKKLTHKISLILNSTGEGIYGVDLDGKVIFINAAGARMLGYEVEELIGKSSHATWHHSKSDGIPFPIEECRINEVLKEGVPGSAENIMFWKKDGTKFPIEYSSTPMFEADALVGAVVTFRDISALLIEEEEKKKLEAQLRHAQKMEAIGTLAGGIAHDFNNILNVILGYGTMVMDKLEADNPSKEQMKEVLIAAERAANLTKRLLLFSRKEVPEFKAIDVNELVINMEKMLSRIIGEDIRLVTDLMGTKAMIRADAGQIEQVLMNLATNARDAMPKGGSLTIKTEFRTLDVEFNNDFAHGVPGTYAVISITDTGTGIDKEKQDRIFDPFFTTKEIGKGTGLGLSITYGIIKQHNGYVKVDSEPGKGATFKIWLPVIEDTAEKKSEVEGLPSLKGGNETILVAEDDASMRKLTRIVLEAVGYTVITAEDGDDVISKFIKNREKIHLVVLDMIMPKKSGKEAYEEIRKISPNIKTLFMSGYTMDNIKTHEIIDAGFNFILKPVLPKDLLKKVRETLDKVN